ncbi:MAG: TonB-dependent receptor [Luteolibacter sp.]
MKLSQSLLFFCALTGIATAQTTQLETLVVPATRTSTTPTVAQSREELAKVAGGAEVIAAGRFLTGRASTMADTFAYSPGVIAQPRFGSDESRLSIRGSGMQRTFHGRGLRLLQDGVPLNLADGGFDMQSVEPLACDHIRVLRGGNAQAIGSSTLGGAIDYISTTGLNSPGGSFRIEGGSFDYLRTRLAAGGSQGNFDGYFSLSEHYLDGFRQHSQQNNQRLFSNAGWKISDNVETRVFFTAIKSQSELPGSLTKAELEDDPRQQDPTSISKDQHRDYEFVRISDKTTFAFGGDSVEVIAGFTYKDLDHPIYQVIDQLSNDAVLGVTYSHNGEFSGRENLLRAGVFYTYGTINASNFLNVNGRRGSLVADADQTATNLDAFIESQQALGYGFTGILGATASTNTRENEVRFGTAQSYDREFHDVSPKVGLRWDAGNTRIYGNFSSSYEPPSFSEANSSTTANKAQTANTIELGTRGEYAAIRWDATIYASKLKNEFLSLNNESGVSLGTTNAGETTHQGIELYGEGDLLGSSWQEIPEHRLLLRGAWTYGRFKFDDDAVYGDNTIAGLPPHLIHAELIWQNKAGYYAGPTVEWVPAKTYVDQANTLSADPYALLGFKFGRRVEKGLSWFIEAKNLTDETYAATTGVIADSKGLDSRNFLPGDGRSLFAGVEWKW